jgi:hypothetical protein
MPETSPTLITVVLAVIFCIVVGGLLLRPKQPPQATFKCARCGSVARHTERTIEAWRRSAKRLFCDSCHRIWLEAQPRQSNGRAYGRVPASSGRGCLGVLFVLAFFPIALVFLFLYA